MISLTDWARVLHGVRNPGRTFMVLSGFFDESGIHTGAHATLIAGFVGSAAVFDAAEAEWVKELKGEGFDEFHYSKMMNREKKFKDCDEFVRARLFSKLAKIIDDAIPDIRLACVSYDGVWNASISNDPGFNETYPTSYSFCFGFMMEALNHWAGSELHERVVPVFAQHQEYAPLALELYDFVRPTGSWPNLGPLAFDDPRQRPALQMADMVLYEMYQALRRADGKPAVSALLSRLWKTEDHAKRGELFNISHNERTLKRALARGPRPWIVDGLSPPICDQEIKGEEE